MITISSDAILSSFLKQKVRHLFGQKVNIFVKRPKDENVENMSGCTLQTEPLFLIYGAKNKIVNFCTENVIFMNREPIPGEKQPDTNTSSLFVSLSSSSFSLVFS
jgi:hypothetical protein